ncbi:TetR/AcrR family transcriptional regulator [Xylanibacillus composti]|uniref:TetR family transcriptional regulator n=1 Tax=Xylanibacillus composti TaxID=1572762 RepID=A0A8J4H7U6_9BACL|nr:TetR/AcrR family transcriptional regulator [Xylanibacillus composti]MDT9727206.1 TetR/AcrR family transcriptional regulator [Xylanibacillus composti]GIQ71515.1 TetR family transcriptional regulator [Xylanibacillus composti]
MSHQSIKEVALHLFAANGYEGTSLADIASQVGIKKQSIYTHFEGKDDLFLQVLEETFAVELDRERAYFQSNYDKPLKAFLWDALQSFIHRFDHDDRLKFWLRNAFLPPSHLYEEVIAYLYRYLDQVDRLYLDRFQHASHQQELKQDPAVATTAFSALVDAIGVEMIYGDEARTERKLHASWQVFWMGISNHDGTSKN